MSIIDTQMNVLSVSCSFIIWFLLTYMYVLMCCQWCRGLYFEIASCSNKVFAEQFTCILIHIENIYIFYITSRNHSLCQRYKFMYLRIWYRNAINPKPCLIELMNFLKIFFKCKTRNVNKDVSLRHSFPNILISILSIVFTLANFINHL